MEFLESSFIYHLIILLFAWSIVFSFIDFIDSNKMASRVAFYLLAIVWGFSSFYMVYTITQNSVFSFLTSREGLYIYVWIIISLSMIINWLVKLEYLVFFTNVVSFLVFSLSILIPRAGKTATLVDHLKSELLYIHIGLAFLAYGAFTLSFIFSVMYLFQYILLKKKKWSAHLKKLGSLDKLEKMVNTFNIFGVPLMLTSLFLGVIWASLRLHTFVWYDTKVLGSFLVLIMYSLFMYFKVSNRFFGKSLCLFNICCFLVLFGNYIVSNLYSSFHLWST